MLYKTKPMLNALFLALAYLGTNNNNSKRQEKQQQELQKRQEQELQ